MELDPREDFNSNLGTQDKELRELEPICERIEHTWAFSLHVYLYKNYNPNHKLKITTIKALYDLQD
jgi:hypothetical protein